jgi:ABC-2 type transport system ATP-binding protein
VAEGSPAALKALTRRERVVRVTLPELPSAAEQALDSLAARTGATVEREAHDDGVLVTVRHPADLAGQVVAALAGQGASLLKLEVTEPTLEDAILALAETSRSGEAATYAAG